MSQFWLDDDDEDGTGNAGNIVSFHGHQQSQNESSSCCQNCGSMSFYYDSTSGRDVCQVCYTQSQQLLTQEAAESSQMEYEDIMELAAKTRGGTLITTKRSKRQRQLPKQQRKPLEDFDQTMPFPDLETCLKGFQLVLQSCTRKLARRLVQLKGGLAPAADPQKYAHRRYHSHSDAQKQPQKSLTATVKHLWIAYLRAFADGAEYYGKQCPEIRISLRDAFVAYAANHKNMILTHLTYQAAQDIRRDNAKEQQQQQQIPVEQTTKDDSKMRVEASSTASTAVLHSVTTSNTAKKPHIKKKKEKTKTAKKKSPCCATAATNHQQVSKLSVTQLINNSCTRREGYKEAALKIKPSMEFIASLLWLAVSCQQESGGVIMISAADLVQWIADGYLPLMNAYDRVLSSLPESSSLQHKLQPIRTFFRLSAVPSVHFVESGATILAVACRMKKKKNDVIIAGNDHDDDTNQQQQQLHQSSSAVVEEKETKIRPRVIRRNNQTEKLCFWSTAGLPMVVARLVVAAGLDQAILNRTLALLNLSVPTQRTGKQMRLLIKKQLVLPSTTLQQIITRNEDILAVIGIACMMDPTWRSQPYLAAKRPLVAPQNETQFSLLDGGSSLESYLDFAENNVLDRKTSLLWDDETLDVLTRVKDNHAVSELRNCYSDTSSTSDNDQDTHTTTPVVMPCPVIAGQTLVFQQSARPSHRQRSKYEVAATEWIGRSTSSAGVDDHVLVVEDDVRRSMLIDFLAYSANARAARIRETMMLLVSEMRKTISTTTSSS